MTRPEDMPVIFDEDFDTLSFNFDSALGFYTEESSILPASTIKFLGFGAPLSPRGGYDAGDKVTPIVKLEDLDRADRTIDINGKGVGPRMYNTLQAAHGLTNLPETFGAYTFDINPLALHDTRQTEGSKTERIVRHGLRIVRSLPVLGSVEKVVNGVHEEYGDADAGLFTQPPRADLRQRKERHAENPDGIPAEFMIILNAAITLRRVGTVRRLG